MSEPYTDKFGYPLTAVEVARRVSRPRPAGFYDRGRWVQLPPKKMAEKPPEPPTKPE